MTGTALATVDATIRAYETLIDEDKRREYDNDNGGKRSHGFDRNPFDEFSDEVYRDRSRTYHDSFTAGSSRKRKGENVVREVRLGFLEAARGAHLRTRDWSQRSNSNVRAPVPPARATNVNRALHPPAASLAGAQAPQCTDVEASSCIWSAKDAKELGWS
ncbi:unnamed protein product [Sphagnum balticum]